MAEPELEGGFRATLEEVLNIGDELAKIEAAIDGFIVGYCKANIGKRADDASVSLRFEAMEQPMFSFLSSERERLRRRLVILNERMKP